MRNHIGDLNNHLFAEIERLSDEELSKEDLEKEVMRAKAIKDVASEILEVGRLELDVVRMQTSFEHQVQTGELPELLKLEQRQ